MKLINMDSLDIGYDYGSIMHYSKHAFSNIILNNQTNTGANVCVCVCVCVCTFLVPYKLDMIS